MTRIPNENVSNRWWMCVCVSFFFVLLLSQNSFDLTGSWKLIQNAAYRWVEKKYFKIWFDFGRKWIKYIFIDHAIDLSQIGSWRQNDRFILIELSSTGESCHAFDIIVVQKLSFSSSIYGIPTSEFDLCSILAGYSLHTCCAIAYFH